MFSGQVPITIEDKFILISLFFIVSILTAILIDVYNKKIRKYFEDNMCVINCLNKKMNVHLKSCFFCQYSNIYKSNKKNLCKCSKLNKIINYNNFFNRKISCRYFQKSSKYDYKLITFLNPVSMIIKCYYSTEKINLHNIYFNKMQKLITLLKNKKDQYCDITINSDIKIELYNNNDNNIVLNISIEFNEKIVVKYMLLINNNELNNFDFQLNNIDIYNIYTINNNNNKTRDYYFIPITHNGKISYYNIIQLFNKKIVKMFNTQNKLMNEILFKLTLQCL